MVGDFEKKRRCNHEAWKEWRNLPLISACGKKYTEIESQWKVAECHIEIEEEYIEHKVENESLK